MRRAWRRVRALWLIRIVLDLVTFAAIDHVIEGAFTDDDE